MPELTRVPTAYSYASAVRAGDLVFLGLHRGFGETFRAQLDDAMSAVQATLEQLGLTLDSLVKVNAWLDRIEDLSELEERFVAYFPTGEFPARMTATTDFHDADCLVMLDGVAYSA
jgi:2-iminobutanoate/2-iminopropanoate deaminase